MAGDTKETTATEVAPPAVDDPFPGIQGTLDAINADGRMDGWEIIALVETAVPAVAAATQSQHARFRCRYLVLAQDFAASVVVTLTIGTRVYRFGIARGISPVIPFPIVIERGVDIAFASVGGPGDVQCYLIGSPE